MKPPFERVIRCFLRASEIKLPQAREEYLAEACKGDAALRQEVDSMLRAQAQSGDFLRATVTLAAQDIGLEPGGMLIGRYKLLETIGEGGFGLVYMAEQQQPVQRRVALKIIKAGMDTREVIARFEAERQALALMDHPNIARVLDAGATETGRPYFVMELVRGIPITDYCDQNHLPMRERLQVFMKVCHAVQHAHQKGVIHRDIKPSNVLVTLHDGEPVPKVIDFGIAKALGQKLTEKTLFTGFSHMIGTPAYMSPEQAELSGLDIDTRADIYSLGVLLYELLTGVTPFDRKTFAKAALDEIRRMIREADPPKPSTRLRTLGDELTDVAKRRHTEPAALSRLVRGDLDWIVMKCLEKDRTRRYETANGLVSDIRRHMNNEPVTAAAPSALYQAGKFARRHRTSLTSAAAFVLLLAFGAAVSTREAIRATRAERQQAQLRKVAEAARNEESHQRQNATKAARESLSQLVRLNVANGARFLDQGDYNGSLAWLNEAFKLSANMEDEDLIHRLRLGMILRQCPRPVQMWFHSDKVNTAEFSPDGQRVLTASRDKTARCWDLQTGQPIIPPLLHTEEVSCASFNADGSLILSATAGGGWVWQSNSGELVRRVEHPGAFYARFSPDGKLIAIGGRSLVRVWSVEGKLVFEADQRATVSHFAFSPDNRLLAAGTYSGTGQIWDVVHQKKLHDLRVSDSFRYLMFSPDSRRLAGADWARAAYLWDTQTGARLKPALPHDSMVSQVTFSSDGRWLASASLDRTVKLWDPHTGALVRLFTHDRFPMAAAFSSDSSHLLTRGLEGALHLWDLRTGQAAIAPIRHSSWITSASLHPDNRRVLTSCADGSVRVWDLEPEGACFRPWSGREMRIESATTDGRWLVTRERDHLQIWNTESWHAGDFTAAVTGALKATFLSDDAQRLVAVEDSGQNSSSDILRVRVWNCDSGTLGSEFDLKSPGQAAPATLFGASADCERLAVVRANAVEVWDIRAGKLLGTSGSHASVVSLLRFSPDGGRLLVNCGARLHVLDASTVKAVSPDLTNTLPTSVAAFSKDGNWIASAGSDDSYRPGTARVWDSTGKMLFQIAHPDGVPALAFTADGRWLATGGEDGIARVWDVKTGAPATPKLSHSSAIVALAFSQDSALLASVMRDGGVLVWDVATGERVTPPLGQGKGATHVRFLVGSRHLLTDGSAGSQLWHLVPSDMPADDLAGLCTLVANHRVDETGAMEPLPLNVQTDLYSRLRAGFPQSFSFESRPGGLGWLTNFRKEVTPRDANAGPELIDLTEYYNARLVDSWHGGVPGEDLAKLPTGTQVLNGVKFDLRGIIQLAGQRLNRYPERIKGISVRLRCRRLHFLHSTGWRMPEGSEIGSYVLHYRNGEQRRLPLVYGNDLRDWWSKEMKAPSASAADIGWEGLNAAGTRTGLYHRVWENPLPEVEITALDFISGMTDCAPFLIALTVEQ